MAGGQPHRGNSSSVLGSNSINRTELKELRLHQHLHLNGDEVTTEETNPVLQKLQKWADYPSYNTWVESTRFLPMKTPMSMEIIESWSLPEAPKHILTVPGLLEEQQLLGRTIGLIIDLSNHDTLYAEDLAEHPEVEYAHIQLVAKAFPGRGSIMQVIKTARSYWRQHPDNYIAIHCAYGFNRTGFVVCAYLIQECGMSVQQALYAFAAARPPGIKHEKFVVELHRRYGHKLAPIPPTPDPELADGASDAHESKVPGAAVLGRSPESGHSLAGRSPPDGGGECSSVAGRSPQTDPGSSMTGTSGASPPANVPGGRARTGPKVIRLYPESAEDPAQPWEPGTPSRETSAATAEVWEALQRGGPAAAYRMRTASELSVAGSAGGRWSEEGGTGGHHSSGDGRFSCSSLYSEFGAVAAHLEEHYPGLAIARKSMRPLPPRSTTSEASVCEQQLGGGARRFSGSSMPGGAPAEDPSAGGASEPGQGYMPPSPSTGLAHPSSDAQSLAAQGSHADGAREGGGAQLSDGRPLHPGLLSTALAQGVSRPTKVNGHPQSGEPSRDPASPAERAANGGPASSSEPWHACLDNHSYSRGGSRDQEHSLSLQKSSISASSLRTESAHSLVNNESLGLDERAVFESFNKAGLHARRKARKLAEAEEESGRMSLQELQGGCPGAQPDLASHQLEDSQFRLDTGSPAAGDRTASGGTAAEPRAQTDTPFAAPAAQEVRADPGSCSTTPRERECSSGEERSREAVGEGPPANLGQPRRKGSSFQPTNRLSQMCRFM